MRISRKSRNFTLALAAVAMAEFASTPPATAIVGAPFSPASVAGVARRTCRRTAVVVGGAEASAAASESAAANQAAASQAAAASQSAAASAAAAQSAAASAKSAAPPPPAAAPSVVASLPQGCVPAGADFKCGNVSYRPYMSGSTVVYVQVAAQ